MLSALCGIGLSVAYAGKVLKAFGPNALSLIRENPYILTKVYGIGFIKADEIARKLGFDDLFLIDRPCLSAGPCVLISLRTLF